MVDSLFKERRIVTTPSGGQDFENAFSKPMNLKNGKLSSASY